ncbi:MAG: dihydrolipoyl dehydrogenase family protein [Opitutales bacterium]
MKKHSLIVIGAGSAGYAAARTAKEHIEDVAVVDSSEELGGLCILKGCMPSKTLIYMAEVMHHAKHGKTFGLNIPKVAADMKSVHERKVRLIDDFSSYRKENLQSDKFTLYRQRGHFINSNTLELEDGTQLQADKFIISTGSRISTPPIPGLQKTPHWTSDDVLDLDFLPESVTVLGGGIVACELAQFLSRMGSKITLIQRSSQVLTDMDPAAVGIVQTAMRDEGINLYTGTKITAISKEPDGIQVSFEHDGQSVSATSKFLFNALGRVPNTTGLRLENAGVNLTPGGQIETNSFQQTSNPIIYAAGDVSGPDEVVHVALKQGETAAKHALELETKPMNYDMPLGVIFTDPQLARVGLSDKELTERGYDIVTADFPFDDHGKSMLMEALYGYVKLVADRKTGKLLAAECVGKDGGELLHMMTVPVQLGLTVFDLKGLDWYHPTLAEIWEYPLEDILEEINE